MPRKQPRRVARELALLGQSQLSNNPRQLDKTQLNQLVLAAIRTLTGEVEDILETAAAEVRRGEERLLASETRASSIHSARTTIADALELTQTAINRLGMALEIPEFVQLANSQDVRDYAIMLLEVIIEHRTPIDARLQDALVEWQLSRLPRIDRQILRIAVAEMDYLDLEVRIAVNEAVELAKRYCDEEGYRFINGVLRRVVNNRREAQLDSQTLPSL